MKKNIGIQCMLIGLSILMVALCVLNINFPLLLFCLFIQIFLLGVNVYDIIKLNQVMKCLIRENKQSKKRNISWEDGDTEKLKMLRRRVEVSALQSQINPHFLYNTLDSIRSKALLDKQTEIAAMTEILSKFFRYCISNDESLVKIKEEINHIRDYYYIQKYRFEDRIDIEIVIEDDEIYELYIPKMTLQPLIENAMIHGLERLAHQG